jgi:hypothetical protein
MTTFDLGSPLPTTPPAAHFEPKFLDGLGELIANSGTNKHDQATNVIIACIDEGIDTGAAIRQVGMALGFNAKHMGVMLSAGLTERRWRRDADGHYRQPVVSPSPMN